MQDMLIYGGKRFRPLLLLGVVESIDPTMIENAMPIALAIEVLHTYSLIHDDLPAMDNADLRRGIQTLHKKYDETTAILVGDALNTSSFNIIANAPLKDSTKIKLIKELSKNGGLGGMVLGQAIDCYFGNRSNFRLLNIDELKFLHIHKTAKLIASSLKMGAIICERDDLIDILDSIGLKLGLIFQIRDDIIDVTYSTEEAGKTTNSDEFKNSFVNLLGVDGARLEMNNIVKNVIEEIQTLETKLQNKILEISKNYFTV
jgi:farnesyl diphosphate synthase